jgi:hypothetical protein
MNKKLEQLEIQKLLQEYSFLLLDEEYKLEVVDANKVEFLNKVREITGALPEPPPPPPQEEQDAPPPKKEKIDPSTVDPSTRDKVKKLYREIAKITHPDKVNSEELVELYMQATTAAEEFDLFTLFEICSKLRIEHSVDGEDKEILKVKIDKKKDKLKNIESSFIWLYAHAKTEQEKQFLINQFAEKHGRKI